MREVPGSARNVVLAHAPLLQKNRRASRRINISRTPAAVSLSRRWSRLWTRRDSAPHAGQADSLGNRSTARTRIDFPPGRHARPTGRQVKEQTTYCKSSKIARPA
jgi:hypothetical protein